MYVPRHFAETRVEVLHELIRRHPLGTLVVAAPDGLEASHVPFEISPEPAPFGTLRCHVARANPIWQQIDPDKPVLVVFQGEQAYVSPSWYAAKQENGKVVPTWNYAAVHAYGSAKAVQDAIMKTTGMGKSSADREWAAMIRLLDRQDPGYKN